MAWLLLALRFLHILSSAAWFGAALFWPGAIRRALAGDSPAHAQAALAQARTALRLDLWAGVVTILSGGAYAASLGAVRHGIWIGAALALVRVGLLLAMAAPALRRVASAVEGGDRASATVAARRLPAYAGAAHLLWLVALLTMVLPT